MRVLDAARNVADDYPGGSRALAARLDKNPWSLMHELHETGTAKLGLKTAVQITARTGDLRILNAFAEECSCVVLPIPERMHVEGEDSLQLLASLASEFNDVVQAYVTAMADGHVSRNELDHLTRQWSELVAVGQHMVTHAQTLAAETEARHIRAVRG